MTDTIRVAGAQIPVCDGCSEYNKVEILKALDWAKENGVEYLLTPECALSGYGDYFDHNYDLVMSQLKEIEEHQKKLGVGLAIGTNIYEEDGTARSQIRHYDKDGNQYARNNKTLVVEGDAQFGITSAYINSTPLDTYDFPGVECRDGSGFKFTGLICNDMWGYELYHMPHYAYGTSLISLMKAQNDLDLVFHATNAYKFFDDHYDTYRTDAECLHMYHEAHLRWMANHIIVNVLTVDSCTRWNWDGNPDTIDSYVTSSPSGLIDPTGAWVTQVPRRGRQFFYYDLDINSRLDAVADWSEKGRILGQHASELYVR